MTELTGKLEGWTTGTIYLNDSFRHWHLEPRSADVEAELRRLDGQTVTVTGREDTSAQRYVRYFFVDSVKAKQ